MLCSTLSVIQWVKRGNAYQGGCFAESMAAVMTVGDITTQLVLRDVQATLLP